MDADKRTKNSNSFEALFAKYSAIWIWSIITGINSGLTYRFYNRVDNYGYISLMIICVTIAGFMASLMAWILLFKALRFTILPMILKSLIHSDKLNDEDYGFSEEDAYDIEVKKKEHANLYRGAYALYSAFQYVIFAIGFLFFASIIEAMLASLGKQ